MNARVRPRPFIVLSDDWGVHPSSAQHLFRQLCKRHPIIWVNTIGMRGARLSRGDLRKAWRKVSRMIVGRQPIAKQEDTRSPLIVSQPLMLPFIRNRTACRFNARSVRRAIDSALTRSELAEPIIVSTVPNAGDYDWPRGSTVVYYCVDDFSLWPGLNAELVREMEARLIERADVLIASSAKQLERLAASDKRAYLLTHGVDMDLFAVSVAHEHPILRDIPRPRVGFFGLIDGRIDLALLSAVARQLPQFSFVLAGPVVISTADFGHRPNVHLPGPVRYADLPALIHGLDVLCIPYRTGPLAEALSPLKLKEYLVTGKPIVSTPIAEARGRADFIEIAATAEEWVRVLESCRRADVVARRTAILPTLAGESWAAKAAQLLEICQATAVSGAAGAVLSVIEATSQLGT